MRKPCSACVCLALVAVPILAALVYEGHELISLLRTKQSGASPHPLAVGPVEALLALGTVVLVLLYTREVGQIAKRALGAFLRHVASHAEDTQPEEITPEEGEVPELEDEVPPGAGGDVHEPGSGPDENDGPQQSQPVVGPKSDGGPSNSS